MLISLQRAFATGRTIYQKGLSTGISEIIRVAISTDLASAVWVSVSGDVVVLVVGVVVLVRVAVGWGPSPLPGRSHIPSGGDTIAPLIHCRIIPTPLLNTAQFSTTPALPPRVNSTRPPPLYSRVPAPYARRCKGSNSSPCRL